MSRRCNLISFGKINKYYFLIPVGAIFYIFLIFIEGESIFFSEEYKHPIIYCLLYSLGLSLSFLFLIIYKIFNKSRKAKTNIAIIEQKNIISSPKQIVSKKEKFLWILLVSIIDYITFAFYSFYWIEPKNLINYWPFDISSLSLFSFLLLKTKLYKHHYISIISILILGIAFDLVLDKYNKINILKNIICFVTEILFQLTYVLYKFFMLKKYIKSYEILFFEGII